VNLAIPLRILNIHHWNLLSCVIQKLTVLIMS